MNLKNFIIGGIVGGIADFLLGWLLWGILFKSFFPPHEESQMNMLFIFLGCMTFGFFISYMINKSETAMNVSSGVKTGVVAAIFISLFANFFGHSMELTPDYGVILTDFLLTLFCGAVVGAIIALINSKLK